MDRGEDLFLVGTEQAIEQGLREAARKLGSLHLRGDEPPDGEEIGPLMKVFGQLSPEHGRTRSLSCGRLSPDAFVAGVAECWAAGHDVRVSSRTIPSA